MRNKNVFFEDWDEYMDFSEIVINTDEVQVTIE